MVPYWKYLFTSQQDPAEWEWDLLQQFLADLGFDCFEQENQHSLMAYIAQEVSPLWDGASGSISPQWSATTFDYHADLQEAQNWNSVWEEESFCPITVGNQLLVCAPRHQVKGSFTHRITLEPQAAFGSGHHQTTQMMLELILTHSPLGKNVVDLGCGTGILGITALALGAQECFLIDIDPDSVQNTLHNLSLNSDIAPDSYTCLQGDAHSPQLPQEWADIYLANIHRNIIFDGLPAYRKTLKPQGWLFVSGMLSEDLSALNEALQKAGFTPQKTFQRNEWIAVAAQRRE